MNTCRLMMAILMLGAMTAAAQSADVVVDTTTQHQTIEGFGTCLIGWVPKMRQFYRTPKFQKIYLDEVGCNMLRVPMWGPTSSSPVEDWKDIDYKKFDLEGQPRATIFMEVAKDLRKRNPDLKIIGSVWSPAAWMKINKSATDKSAGAIFSNSYTRKGRTVDNRVDPKYYRHFAKWMVEYVKMHKAAGAPFYAVSIGNEVMFTQSFGSCVWTADDYAKVVAIVGEMLEKEGFGDVKLFGPETMTGHNYVGGNPGYIKALMDGPAAKYLTVFATHGYTDGFRADMSSDSSAQFWDLIKQYKRPLWVTEGGTGSHEWPGALNDVGAMMHNALVAGNASAILPWQITEDKNSTHNLMFMDKFTKKTRVVQQFFRCIPVGAVRVDAKPEAGSNLQASAFVHAKSAGLTVIVLNPSDKEQAVTIRLPKAPSVSRFDVHRTSADDDFKKLENAKVLDGTVALTMPAQSIVSLVGRTDRR